MKMDEIIKNAEKIEIVSGEGTQGTTEEYVGKRTLRAICTRLQEEECSGDRWAFARIDGRRYYRNGYKLDGGY